MTDMKCPLSGISVRRSRFKETELVTGSNRMGFRDALNTGKRCMAVATQRLSQRNPS